jgi:hypothetical protein
LYKIHLSSNDCQLCTHNYPILGLSKLCQNALSIACCLSVHILLMCNYTSAFSIRAYNENLKLCTNNNLKGFKKQICFKILEDQN